MEIQLSRIAQAFERIADSLERIESKGLDINTHTIMGDINANLLGPLCIQHEFTESLPLGLLHVEPNERAFKIEVSNCTDTELPFGVQIND